MLIQKLLRYPNVPGPYLGPSRAAEADTGRVSFQALIRPLEPPPPIELKSLSQHLELSIRVRQVQGQQPKVAPQYQPNSKTISQLSNTVQSQLLQHPVDSRCSDAYLQELLLLLALRHASGHHKAPEQLIPSPFAILSYVPITSPLRRDKADPKKLKVGGKPFVHFRFAWEDEDFSDSEKDQKREPESEASETGSEAPLSEAP